MGRGQVLTLAAATAALAMAAGPAGAVNVIQNPGADGDAPGAAVSAWRDGNSVSNAFVAKPYDPPGGSFPTTDVSAANGGGPHFFWAGSTGVTQMLQTYTPTAEEIALIDAGKMEATVAADLGGWSSQDDRAEVTVTFWEPGNPVGTLRIEAVTAADRENKTTLLKRSVKGPVPPGTRFIDYEVTATREGGSSNDGYVDNLFLELGESSGAPAPTPPPPAPDTRGIPNPRVKTSGPAVAVTPATVSLAGCRRGQKKSVSVRVQTSAAGDVYVSIFSGVSSTRLFGSRWVGFTGPGSRKVPIKVPCPAKTADVRTVGLTSGLAAVERGDRRGIATPQAKTTRNAAVIAPRARPVRGLRKRRVVEVRVRARRAGRVVVRVTGRARGLRFSGQATVRFAQPGSRLVRIRVRLRGSGRSGNATLNVAAPRFRR